MKAPKPDHPVRNTLTHLALALTMGGILYFGATPASAAPPVTAGLKLHLDASALTGLSDGATVTTWNDASGLGNHATASGTPIYKTGMLNGRPVIRFNDASSVTTANLASQFPTAASMFVVTTINNDTDYTLVRANNGVDEWWRWGGDGKSYPGFFRSSRIETYTSTPSSGSLIFEVSSSSSAWEMLMNGASQGVRTGAYAAASTIIVGDDGTGRSLNGDIAEVILYNRVLTPVEANQVGEYLETKYALNTNYGPPVISTLSPADEATVVPVTPSLVVTFSDQISNGSGNITIKNLTDGIDTIIPVTDTTQISISGSVLTINPNANLLFGKNYAIQIDPTAIKDSANIAFVGITNNTTWNFVTAAAPGSFQPGLRYGTVAGNINTTDANPRSLLTVDLSQTENSITENITEIYTGRIYDADGQIAFTAHIDENIRLYIDGILVLSSDVSNVRVSTGNLNLAPGWHEFELRLSNGTGGSGPVTNPGFGYDPNGGTNWTHPSDPGSGSLFRSHIGPGSANNPLPLDTAMSLDFDTNLSWTAGIDAVSRNVYLGTNPSPGASELRGNQTATTYDPGTLANGTYYWRIDEVNADGVTPGRVWSFTVGPPSKAIRPMPWDGLKAVSTTVDTLKWVAGKSVTAVSHDVYFGTDSTPDSSEFKGNQTGTSFNPGPLAPATTYYWRIDQVNAQGTTTGDVWIFTTPGTSANKVKVFILAGQSNMVGHGQIEPLGTQGTLQSIYNNDPVTYAHLKTGSSWVVRDDAWVWYKRDGTLIKGGLTTGYGADSNRIGPELQFGHAMGIHYGQKVLLIKTAWGGKSLETDFRPPSAGWSSEVPKEVGDQGYYFTEMLKDVIDATVNLQTHFPAYNPADGFEIAGFAWHQGFNDVVSSSGSAEYEVNMEKFIKDLRLAVGVPNLPFVIATTGQTSPTNYSAVELAQLQMENFTKYPAFNGNVAVVDAKSFNFPISASPGDEGHHWNRNAKSYYMIGDSLASEMRTLITNGGGGDSTAPETSSLSPANGATGVAISANLVATFGEEIVIGTGNITIKNLTDGTNTTIAVPDSQVTISSNVLTINPAVNLLGSKNYAVQIAATSIDDIAGNSFAGISDDTTWNFTTAVADTTAPTVSAFNPADNAIGVSVTGNLVVTFSEPIVIGTGNITLKNLTDATVTTVAVTDAQVTVSGATLTINPTANLLGGKNYAILIDATSIDDSAGNSFAGIANDTTWSFTTENINSTPVTTGLKLHLDASRLTGLNDGSILSSWPDMSGLGNHATAAGTPIFKPGVLNGMPVIRFNNSSSFTTANLSAQFPSAATVFIVTTLNNDDAYTLVKANPGVDEHWRFGFTQKSYPAVFRASRLEDYCIMPSTGSHLFAITSSASAWEMSINGIGQGVAGGNYNSGGALVIGNGSSGGGLNGDIAEVLIYSRVLAAPEVNAVGYYLETKYGIDSAYQNTGGFGSWATANAPGQFPGEDYDNDGVENGIEYFMGESGSSFTANPSLNASNAISWPASAAFQGTYEVQSSPDLATWTNVDPRPVSVGGILSYTLPPGAAGGKSFVRLLVTPTP